jgi:hypothetical protein
MFLYQVLIAVSIHFWFFQICLLTSPVQQVTRHLFRFQRSLNCDSMSHSLSNIERKINHKIKELKDKMKKTNQRIETEGLE